MCLFGFCSTTHFQQGARCHGSAEHQTMETVIRAHSGLIDFKGSHNINIWQKERKALLPRRGAVSNGMSVWWVFLLCQRSAGRGQGALARLNQDIRDALGEDSRKWSWRRKHWEPLALLLHLVPHPICWCKGRWKPLWCIFSQVVKELH